MKNKTAKRNWKKYVTKLNDENQKIFWELKEYVACSDKMYAYKEECIEEILDLMISAKSNELEMKNVIGEDYGKFCDNILESSNETNKAQRNILRFCSFLFSVILMGCCAIVCEKLEFSFGWEKAGKVNLFFPFVMILILFFNDTLDNKVIKKIIAKNNKSIIKKRKWIRFLSLIISIIVYIFILEISQNYIMKIEWLFFDLIDLITIGLAVFFGAAICFFIFSSEKSSGYNHSYRKKDEFRNKIIENFEKKYQKWKIRILFSDAEISDIDARDEFIRSYKRKCKVSYLIIFISLILSCFLLLFSIQILPNESFFVILVILFIIFCSLILGLGIKQRKYIEVWRIMKS